jgi:hypothetical protein
MPNWGCYFTVNNIIALIIAIVGMIWIIHAIWRNWKIGRISAWSKTDALVLTALVAPANLSADNMYIDPKYIIPTVDNSARYVPIVVYRYSVGGHNYQSNSVVYSGPSSYSALDTKTIMRNITTGATISVYYNPHNPSESYIYIGTKNYVSLVLGIILLLIAIYLGYQGISTKSNKSQDLKKINVEGTCILEKQTSKSNGIPITPFSKSFLRNFLY